MKRFEITKVKDVIYIKDLNLLKLSDKLYKTILEYYPYCDKCIFYMEKPNTINTCDIVLDNGNNICSYLESKYQLGSIPYFIPYIKPDNLFMSVYLKYKLK